MAESQISGGRPPDEAAHRSRALLDRLAAGDVAAHAARDLGQALGRLRRSRNLTRKEVAKASGLTEDDVILFEWGLFTLSEVRERLDALALGCQTTPRVLELILQTHLGADPTQDLKGGRLTEDDIA